MSRRTGSVRHRVAPGSSGRTVAPATSGAAPDVAMLMRRYVAGPVLAWAAAPGAVWAGSAAAGHALAAPLAAAIVATGVTGAGISLRRGARTVASVLDRDGERRSAAEVNALLQRAEAFWRKANGSLESTAALLHESRTELAAAQGAAISRGAEQDQEFRRLAEGWLAYYQQSVAGIRDSVTQVLASVRDGHVPARPPFPALPPAPSGRFDELNIDLALLGHTVVDAVVQAAVVNTGPADAELKVFANVAQRLHSAADRVMIELQALENTTEDPEALDRVLRADHRANLIRRDADSILVLAGGELQQRGGPTALATVLRQSTSECEHFSRVDILPAPAVNVVPYVRSSLIHIVAALLENGTRFSRDDVQLSGAVAASGLVITVTDRGLHMPPEDLRLINARLADPDPVVVRERLAEGRIGLLVSAKLGRKYGLSVVLYPGHEKGTRAEVTVPANLLVHVVEEPAVPPAPQHPARDAGPARRVSGATGQSASPPAPAAVALATVSPISASAGPMPQHRRPKPSDGDDSGTRPVLPRRRRPQAADAPAPARRAPAADAGEIAPGLIGAFIDGAQEGAAVPPSAREGAAPHPDGP